MTEVKHMHKVSQIFLSARKCANKFFNFEFLEVGNSVIIAEKV